MSNELNEEEAKKALDNIDEQEGINQNVSVEKDPVEKPSLGKSLAAEYQESEISSAADPGYKMLPIDMLPSQGLSYPENCEMTIRPATSAEIRHWSTLDQYDRVAVFDMLNFILEKCVRLKIKGTARIIPWNTICEIDRLYIIFRIHELTFPNGKNQLSTFIQCNEGCKGNGYADRHPIRSAMLRLYNLPDEVMQWYSAEERCFVMNSEKLNEQFKLYFPTVGALQKRRAYIANLKKRRQTVDAAFIKVLPYLLGDWSRVTNNTIQQLYFQYKDWPDNKFFFITKFSELLAAGKLKHLELPCPSCGDTITTDIFSSNSFGVKDLFFVSSGLNELI